MFVSVQGVFLYFFIYKNHADKERERDHHFDIQRLLKTNGVFKSEIQFYQLNF